MDGKKEPKVISPVTLDHDERKDGSPMKMERASWVPRRGPIGGTKPAPVVVAPEPTPAPVVVAPVVMTPAEDRPAVAPETPAAAPEPAPAPVAPEPAPETAAAPVATTPPRGPAPE